MKLKCQIEKGERDVGRSKSKKSRVDGRKQEIMEEIRDKVEQNNLCFIKMQGIRKHSPENRDKVKSQKKIKESKASDNKVVCSVVWNSHFRNSSEQVKHETIGRKASLN